MGSNKTHNTPKKAFQRDNEAYNTLYFTMGKVFCSSGNGVGRDVRI